MAKFRADSFELLNFLFSGSFLLFIFCVSLFLIECLSKESVAKPLHDKTVFILYLVIIFGIGLASSRKENQNNEYFLAGRSMGWLPIGLSVMVTSFSAINYLAIPSEIFGYGLYVIVSFPVFFLAAWPISQIWMPYFHNLCVTSVYEILEKRYDVRVRSLASGLFILWRFFWMATALYASGKIMGALTGWPQWLLILLCGLIATLYTSNGGMRAVMWTDVAQFFVLFGGIALCVILSFRQNGSDVFRLAFEGGRLQPFAPLDGTFFSFDPRIRMTLWSGLVGTAVTFMARYGADQVVMQRYLTAKSLKAAQKGIWLNAAASTVSLSLLVLLGMALYANACCQGAFAADNGLSLPAAQGQALALKQLSQLIRSFPPGVTGLILAGLMAATMSSIDSGINACTAAYVTDFQKRFNWEEIPSYILSLLIGVISTSLALLLIPAIGKSNSVFAIVNKLVNGLGSPLLCLMLLGMFSKRTNATGVFYGGIVGLLLSLGISFWLKPLALQYYAVANLLACLAACYVFSFCFKNTRKHKA